MWCSTVDYFTKMAKMFKQQELLGGWGIWFIYSLPMVIDKVTKTTDKVENFEPVS